MFYTFVSSSLWIYSFMNLLCIRGESLSYRVDLVDEAPNNFPNLSLYWINGTNYTDFDRFIDGKGDDV